MSESPSGMLRAETIERSSLYNKDLAPVPGERRTWRTYNYAALWISMSVNIPTYMLASGMIAGGMNWKQALFTVFLGNVLVLIPMLLNAHAGAQYGIPFPIFARASCAVRGGNVVAILRALVVCGCFFIPSLTGVVGFWATVSLNIPDFTRYARSQRDQALGQALGLPATMTFYSFIGIAVTSSTLIIFGEALWDPVKVLARLGNPWAVAIAMLGLLI